MFDDKARRLVVVARAGAGRVWATTAGRGRGRAGPGRDADDLLEPAAAGRRAGAVRGGGQRRQARARAGRRQGREVPGQVRLARRLHGAGRRLGAQRGLGQRAQGRQRRLHDRLHRRVQLGRDGGLAADPQRGGDRAGQPGQHRRRHHLRRPRRRARRAGQVLPDRQADLRPRAAEGHLPGRRAGHAGQGEGLRLGLHHQRQGGLRRGPGQERRALREEAGPGDQGQRRDRQERRQLPLGRAAHQGAPARSASSTAASRPTTRSRSSRTSRSPCPTRR